MTRIIQSLTVVFLVIICSWGFFSAVNINDMSVCGICLVIEAVLLIIARERIIINGVYLLWMISVILMFTYTDKLTTRAREYNSFFFILVLMVIVFASVAEDIPVSMIINILAVFAVISMLIVVAELVFREGMEPLISLFLSGSKLQTAVAAMETGEGCLGLASSPNILSHSAMLLISYCVYLKRDSKRFFNAAIILLAVFIVVYDGERTDLVFIPLSMLITYFFQAEDHRFDRIIKIVCIIAVVMGVVVLAASVLVNFRLFSRVFESVDIYFSGDDVLGARGILYNRAINLWQGSPLIGNGWFYFFNNNRGIISSGVNSHVHNMILELLCDGGIVGVLLILAPMIWIYCLNIKAVREAGEEEKGIYRFTLALQSFFFMDTMLHVTFFLQNILMMYFMTVMIFFISEVKRNPGINNGILRRKEII